MQNGLLAVIFTLFCFSASYVTAQTVVLDGYVYESGNRGFLNVVRVDINTPDGVNLASTFTDVTGHFTIEVKQQDKYVIQTTKDMFDTKETEVSGDGKTDGDKIFVKLEMKRSPGYIFEITLAEVKEDDEPVDAIKGARIEVYNNTTSEEVLAFIDHPEPHFNVDLLKGNHYTVLVRKEGYLAKRMEAFVDVEGCILCFEGLGSVTPGVSDNLSEGNQMGVLLANVELEKIYPGKTIPISNILYEYTSAELDRNDEDGLKALATLMRDNPDLTVEIGSHTDSRGRQDANMELSEERAKNVVNFLIDNDVSRNRLVSKGYGEMKLLNGCTSFVECTEKQHAINRRTELKVLGIASEKAPIKSLAQIKRMEKAMDELKDLQFGGQIKIPEAAGSDTNIDQSSLDSLDKSNEAKIAATTFQPQKTLDAMQETIEETVTVSNASERVIANSDNASAVAEMAVSKEPAYYKISIKQADHAISKDSDMFKRHSNLMELEQDNIYYYLIGHFENREAAEQFHQTSVKLAYPEAKVVEIKAGVVQ